MLICMLQLPNYGAHEGEDLRTGGFWAQVSLSANLFTEDEFPITAPASNPIFSAGEELSESVVVALKWSPPGLASHGRSALAVLTSNLILSIWESFGYPVNKSSSWKRRLTINDTLTTYAESLYTVEGQQLSLEQSETAKCFQRVRSFAWAPILSSKDPVNVIAVANDNAEIVILAIQPQSVNLSSEQAVAVVSQFRIDDGHQINRITQKTSFEEGMRYPCYASHIAWSPWIQNISSSAAIIAFVRDSEICFLKVTVSLEPKFSISIERLDLKWDLPAPRAITGPFKFDKHVQDDFVHLITSVGAQLLSCQVNIRSGKLNTRYSSARDDWDDISGATILFASIMTDFDRHGIDTGLLGESMDINNTFSFFQSYYTRELCSIFA
jgi:Transcription factor IIIC subunit delta N-term